MGHRTGELEVPGLLWSRDEFEASLGDIKLSPSTCVCTHKHTWERKRERERETNRNRHREGANENLIGKPRKGGERWSVFRLTANANNEIRIYAVGYEKAYWTQKLKRESWINECIQTLLEAS